MATRTEAAPERIQPALAVRPARGPRAPGWWWIGLGGLAAAGFGWAIFGSLEVFPKLTSNSDEGAYLAQAAALRAGQILPHAPSAHVGMFQPWFTVVRDGHFIYKYSPVFPAMLAIGHWLLGAERGALGLIAATSVVLVALLAREVGGSRRAALLGAGAFLLAPLYLIQSSTFLPYAGNLMLLLAFVVLLLRGTRTGTPWMVVVAGLALGAAFWARSFDTVVFAAPVVAWLLLRRPRAVSRARTVALLGAGVVPGIVGFLAYNALATGSPFNMPFQILDQSDTIGLGNHRMLWYFPYVDYTLGRAWDGTVKNMLLVSAWSFGSVVLLILAVFGYLSKPRVRGRSLLVVMLLSWPIGFFFFWGSYSYVFLWDGGWQLGPYYYLPMLVPLCVAAGIGLDRGLSRSLVLGAIAVALCVGVTIPVAAGALSDARASTRPRLAVNDALERATDGRRSIVFLSPVYGAVLQHPLSFLRNAPDYDGSRLYAVDSGNADLVVAREHPDRRPVVVSLPDGYGVKTVPLPVWADRAFLVNGRAMVLGADVPDGLASSGLHLRVGAGLGVIDVPFTAGAVRFRLGVDANGRVEVATLDGSQTMAVSSPGVAPAGGLGVQIVKPLTGNEEAVLMTRRVAIALDGQDVSVLWPGTITASKLPPDVSIGWSSRVSVPARR